VGVWTLKTANFRKFGNTNVRRGVSCGWEVKPCAPSLTRAIPKLWRLEKLFSIEDRGHADRVTALPRPYALLTFDLDPCPWLSTPGELWSWSTHTQTLKFKDQSVQQIDWKQMDGRTDGRYAIALLFRTSIAAHYTCKTLYKCPVYMQWRLKASWRRGQTFMLPPPPRIGLRPPLNLGQVVHTYICASVTKQYNLLPAKGRWCSAAGKVTAGLAECNGSLPPGGWLIVTFGLTACTPGSAPGAMLGNEYGKPLPLPF